MQLPRWNPTATDSAFLTLRPQHGGVERTSVQARVLIQTLCFRFCLGGNDEQRRAPRGEGDHAAMTASRPGGKQSTDDSRASAPADPPILDVHSLAGKEKHRDPGGELGRVSHKDPLWPGWRDLEGLEAYCRTRRLAPRLIAALQEA